MDEGIDFQLASYLSPFEPLLGDELLGVLETMPEHMAHQYAVDFRYYLAAMRRAWSWHFSFLFEMHLYCLSLERTLQDYHRLHPPLAPGSPPFPALTGEDRSFMQFLAGDMQCRFDATCESMSWHYLRQHIPVFEILLQPARSSRIRE